MRRTGSDPWAPGFPVTLKDYFHRTNFLWTPVVSPASHAKDRFVLLRVPSCLYFCFRFLSVYAAGFPRNSSLVLPLHSSTGFLVYLLNSSINQRRRMTNSLICCNQFSCIFCEMWFFDRWSSGKYTHDPRRASKWKNCKCFFNKHNCHE